jgi:hypothetical protein
MNQTTIGAGRFDIGQTELEGVRILMDLTRKRSSPFLGCKIVSSL